MGEADVGFPMSFRHEGLLYAGVGDLVARAIPFIQEAIGSEEPILVALVQPKADRVRDELGADARHVRFEDVSDINPAKLIPMWRDFVDQHEERRTRGIGEAAWPRAIPEGRTEWFHHEALMNLAFERGRSWWLLCPYDVEALGTDVLEPVRRTHPSMVEHDVPSSSDEFAGPRAAEGPFDDPLAEPEHVDAEAPITDGTLERLRRLVADRASMLSRMRRSDLVLAVDELATNTIRHGGGTGRLRMWRDAGALVCEIADHGRITDPLAGRVKPDPERESGRGLWIANQVCDLVQIRTFEQGSVVRAFMALDR